MTETKLPQTLTDLKTSLNVESAREIVSLLQNTDDLELTESQIAIKKYSGNALCIGRPLDSTFIALAGATGAGKSSTINALFNDSTLCPTNDYESETSEIALIRKSLKITKESPTLLTTLNFVDMPGTFDTNQGNEEKNLVKIKRFKESTIELADRTEVYWMIRGYLRIPKHVYPNLVLFVVSATDNRMKGPDSILMKTLQMLRKTGELIDFHKKNLIVVLTHVMNLSPNGNPDSFVKSLKEIKEIIRNAVNTVLEVQEVEVVPIENRPEIFGMVKEGDYYQLPNGEWSHQNLFLAMQRRFEQNKDLLGAYSIAWYYKSDCPEREIPAEVIFTEMEVAKEAIEEGPVWY